MNIEVLPSVALIGAIVAPAGAVAWVALKSYAAAHRDLLRWQSGEGSKPRK